MTIRNGLFFENNKTGQHAQDVRLMLKGLLGGTTGTTTGVGGATHLKVTEKAGTPNMSVDVAPGHFFIEGSRNSAQGTYYGYNDATVNVPLSASDPTNPRIDLIYVRVRDSAYDASFAGQDDTEIVVLEGEPAAVPVEPTVTDEDYLLLAAVTVGAEVSAIEDEDIEDRRVASPSWTQGRGFVARKQSAGGPTGIANTLTDLTDLSITFDAVEGRRYRVSCVVRLNQSGASGTHVLEVADGSNTFLFGASGENVDSGSASFTHLSDVIEPDGGPMTVKVRARTTGGTAASVATNINPYIAVEDVGGYLL